MERAARLFRNKCVAGEVMSSEDLARAAWPVAVGKQIAARTGRVKLVRSRLVVEVEDQIWQRQLFSLSGQIVSNLARVTGSNIVTEIEFRVGVLRKQATSHERPVSAPLFEDPDPEAAAILDPTLRLVYEMSRKRRSA